MKLLGRNIRVLREARGFKSKDVAEKAELTPGYYSRVENGLVKQVSVDVIMRIADAMSVPTAALFKDNEIVDELVKYMELTKKFLSQNATKLHK